MTFFVPTDPQFYIFFTMFLVPWIACMQVITWMYNSNSQTYDVVITSLDTLTIVLPTVDCCTHLFSFHECCVAADSSHMTTSSYASWNSFIWSSNFGSGHVLSVDCDSCGHEATSVAGHKHIHTKVTGLILLHSMIVCSIIDRMKVSWCVLLLAGSTVCEKLHPSWEASRQRKQRERNVFVFQGTRKTFSDDDWHWLALRCLMMNEIKDCKCCDKCIKYLQLCFDVLIIFNFINSNTLMVTHQVVLSGDVIMWMWWR